ncbi:hypothetical protein [Enterococcus gallinarum]|uniref:hypothetical protein n=1 Tax=Enterococcus gallinarum TaxID=1353 RepID=UPI001D1721A9|nr:hypothetical protein [Enterococcus gallinarum]MCC4045588.1 hypothetical protein [Enterococcus gallinarum]
MSKAIVMLKTVENVSIPLETLGKLVQKLGLFIIISAAILTFVVYTVKKIKSMLFYRSVNKNLLNWIYRTNFGQATVILNALSIEKEINFQKKKPFSNLKEVDKLFASLEDDELGLIKDYLIKNNRRFKLFEDKLVERTVAAIQITGLVSGVVTYIMNGNLILLVAFGLMFWLLMNFINKYEKERNIREVLLMFIDRAERKHQNN